MTTVARRVKPSWIGNSGMPEPPPEVVVELVVVVDVVAGLVLVVEVVEVAEDMVERLFRTRV
jgi:hypothetical protein